MLSPNHKQQEPKVGTTPLLKNEKSAIRWQNSPRYFPPKNKTKLFSFVESRRNVHATSPYLQFERKPTWWFANIRKSCQIETPFFGSVKRAKRPSLNRMWRHFLLDDPDTKISRVFCPAPENVICRLIFEIWTNDFQLLTPRDVRFLKKYKKVRI